MDTGYLNSYYQVPKGRLWSYMNRPRYSNSIRHGGDKRQKHQGFKHGNVLAVIVLIIIITTTISLAIYFSVKANDSMAYENTATLEATFYLPETDYHPDFAIKTSEEFAIFTKDFCNDVEAGLTPKQEGFRDCIVTNLRKGSVIVDADLTYMEDAIRDFDDTTDILMATIVVLKESGYGDVTGHASWDKDTLDLKNRNVAKTTEITKSMLTQTMSSAKTTSIEDTGSPYNRHPTRDSLLKTTDTTNTYETVEGTTIIKSTPTLINDLTSLYPVSDDSAATEYQTSTATDVKFPTTSPQEEISDDFTSTQTSTHISDDFTTYPESTITMMSPEELTTQEQFTAWSSWSDWGNCDNTCGSGYKQRSRTCSNSNCVGSYTQSDSCFKSVCPRAAQSYNAWSTWGAWTPCDATCGNSTQRRERVCGQDDQKHDCIGSNFMERTCNVGACPDCSKPCAGVWVAECLICQCTGTNLTGRVVTQNGGPLDNVVVTSLDKSYVNLTVTGQNGGFSISNICSGQELVFTRAGYQTKTTTYSAQSIIKISMGKIVPLTIVQQSNHVGRLSGTCLELECKAIGYPEPYNYEWFRDGLLLLQYTSSTIVMGQVLYNDTGLYRCRANNDYGAALSEEIRVIVKDTKEEFCTKIPKSYTKQLPNDCIYNGKSEVELGICNTGLCSMGGEETCAESSRYHCSVVTSDLIYANCSTYQLPLQFITECGCVEKEESYLELVGIVKNSRNGEPIAGISVNYGSESVNTSEAGEFVINLTPGLNKVTFDLTDPLKRYVQQISVVRFGQNFEGSIDYTVNMNPKAPPIIASAEQEIILELGNGQENTPAFADIIIPRNSMYDSKGETYNGTVQISVDIFDPRENQTDANPPGDFTATDDEGEESTLISSGMMRLSVEDEKGNSLNMGGEMEISLDEDMLGESTDIKNIKLWALDKITGKWIYVANLDSQAQSKRRKRSIYSANVRGIDIDSEWFNFDAVSDQICHTKFRIYQSNNFYAEEQLSNVDVKVITLPSRSSPGTTLTRVRSATDDTTTDANGYCIVHPCNSPRSTTAYDYHGYILADFRGVQMIPSNGQFDAAMNFTIEGNKIHVNFDYFAGADGPFYDWDYYWSSSTQCSDAPVTDLHFTFYKDDVTQCGDYEYTILPSIILPVPNVKNYHLWNVPGPRLKYSACFIKVLTTWESRSTVQAISSVGHAETNVLQVGDIFGVRRECTDNSASCVEVRSPFGITDGVVTFAGLILVTIQLTDGNPQSYLASQALLEIGDVSQTENASLVYIMLRNMTYSSGYGVYCKESSLSLLQAKQLAENSCRRGSNNDTGHGIQKTNMTQNGWAVQFNDFLPVIPENGTCPGGYTPERGCWGSADVDAYNEYCTHEHFVCYKCPYTYDIPISSVNGECSIPGDILFWEGCCPEQYSCPGGQWASSKCNISTYIRTPWDYCTNDGYICNTCRGSWDIPVNPTENGNCSDSNRKLDSPGCCPITPLCPNGYEPHGDCNYRNISSWGDYYLYYYYYYYYCTDDGYMCEKCHYEIYGYGQILPESINENGTCTNLELVQTYAGCCPSCPGRLPAIGYCTNSSVITDYRHYCTDDDLVCETCPAHYTIPEPSGPYGKCNNDTGLEWWQGCCPPIPICPGGYYSYRLCQKNTDCDEPREYCSEEGTCCNTCHQSWVIPEKVNDDRTCNNSEYGETWRRGCCPVCPGGNEPFTTCTNDTECGREGFCTSSGLCCYLCYPTGIVPEYPNPDRSCYNTSYGLMHRGCCPVCPGGRESYDICTQDSDCDRGHFCTRVGLCCEVCHPTMIVPEYPNKDQTCNNTRYGVTYYGCCPVCPGGSSYHWWDHNSCMNHTDCNTQDFCTQDGLCCSRCQTGDIPDFHHGNEYCDKRELGYEATYEGCCPACPGGHSGHGTCYNDSECYSFEFCNDAGMCCYTCPGSDNKPQSVATDGTCADPNLYATGNGCCPLCSNSQTPSGSCHNSTECGSQYYCTHDELCCEKCPISKADPGPMFENKTCEENEYELVNQGCCPVFPRCYYLEYPSRSCDNTTGCHSYEYCTKEGVCCRRCPLFYTIPDTVPSSKICSNPKHEVMYEGCCPRRPKCPNNYDAYTTCTNSTECDWNNYCTEDDVCCELCPVYQTIPDPKVNDQVCEKQDYQATYAGCCPVVPRCFDGRTPNRHCTTHWDCYWNEYCTKNNVCCKTCLDSYLIPDDPQANNTCDGPYHEYTKVGCCPNFGVCPNGYSKQMACQYDFECNATEYCTDTHVCCVKCPLDDAIPGNDTCEDPFHQLLNVGCCPAYPRCPNNRNATQACQVNTDCSLGEYCTSDEVCCPFCPNNNTIPEPMLANGTCANESSSHVDDIGCCPVISKCPNNQVSNQTCSRNTNCDVGQYCSYYNVCCDSCPFFNSTPDFMQANGTCNKSNHEITFQGCCPKVSPCPGGMSPLRLCNDTAECGTSDMFCNFVVGVGFCCNTCPMSANEPEYETKELSCINGTHVYKSDYGCCEP